MSINFIYGLGWKRPMAQLTNIPSQQVAQASDTSRATCPIAKSTNQAGQIIAGLISDDSWKIELGECLQEINKIKDQNHDFPEIMIAEIIATHIKSDKFTANQTITRTKIQDAIKASGNIIEQNNLLKNLETAYQHDLLEKPEDITSAKTKDGILALIKAAQEFQKPNSYLAKQFANILLGKTPAVPKEFLQLYQDTVQGYNTELGKRLFRTHLIAILIKRHTESLKEAIEARQEIALAILQVADTAAPNSRAFNFAEQALSTNFEATVANLSRKVGLINNSPLLINLYQRLVNFIFGATEDSEAAEQLRWAIYPDDNDEVIGLFSHNGILSFYDFNPNPQLLKDAVAIYTKENLLTIKEKKAIDRLINQMPKNDLARDQRRDLHRFVHSLAVSRAIDLDHVTELFSPLLEKMQTDTFSSQLSNLLKVERYDKCPSLPQTEVPPKTQEAINQALTTYHGTSSSKEQKKQRNIIKAYLQQIEQQYNAKLCSEFLHLAKLLASTTIVNHDASLAKTLTAKLPQEKKHYNHDDYARITQSYIKTMTDQFRDSAITLEPSDLDRLEEHIKQHPHYWLGDNFYIDLLKYHQEQDPQSKIQVEEFFSQVMMTDPSQEQTVTKMQISTLKKDSLINQLNKSYSHNYQASELRLNLEESYATIRFNIFEHLDINSFKDLSAVDFKKQLIDQYGTESYEELTQLTQEIDIALTNNEAIEMQKINKWQK